jgi:WD40 repeat protein
VSAGDPPFAGAPPPARAPRPDEEDLARLAGVCSAGGLSRGFVGWWRAFELRATPWSPSALLRTLREDGRCRDVLRLLFDFRWIRAHVAHDPGRVRSLARSFHELLCALRADARGTSREFDHFELESVRLVHSALVTMLPLLGVDSGSPAQLATQLYGRLAGLASRFSMLKTLVDSIRIHAPETGPWFRPLNNCGFDEPMTDVEQTMRADDATVVAIAKDGTWVAAAGGPVSRFSTRKRRDYPISVWRIGWSAVDVEPDRLLEVHDTEVTNLAISPCAQYLVSSSVGQGEGSLKVWHGMADWVLNRRDAPTPHNLDSSPNTGFVTSIAISSDSKFVVAAFQKQYLVKLWTIGPGKPMLTRCVLNKDASVMPRNLALSSDGRYFAYVSGRTFKMGSTGSSCADDFNSSAVDVWRFGLGADDDRLVATLALDESCGEDQQRGIEHAGGDSGAAASAEGGKWAGEEGQAARRGSERLLTRVSFNDRRDRRTSSNFCRPTLSSVEFLESGDTGVCVATGGTKARGVPGRGLVALWSITRSQNRWMKRCVEELVDEDGQMGCVAKLALAEDASVKALFSGSDDGLVRMWRLCPDDGGPSGAACPAVGSRPSETMPIAWSKVDVVAIGAGNHLPAAGTQTRGVSGRGDVTMAIDVSLDGRRCVSVSSDRSLIYVWDVGMFSGPGGTMDTWKRGGVYRPVQPPSLLACAPDLKSLDGGLPLSGYFEQRVGMLMQTRHNAEQVASETGDCVEVDVPGGRGAAVTHALFFDCPVVRCDYGRRGFASAGTFKLFHHPTLDPRERVYGNSRDEEQRRGVAVRFADESVALLELEEALVDDDVKRAPPLNSGWKRDRDERAAEASDPAAQPEAKKQRNSSDAAGDSEKLDSAPRKPCKVADSA